MQVHCTLIAQDLLVPCRFLLFEVVAGTAVARIAAGEELVVLRRKATQQGSK